MSWEDAAIVEYDEMAGDMKAMLEIFEQRGIPISPDYLVLTERCGDKFVYRWKRKSEITP